MGIEGTLSGRVSSTTSGYRGNVAAYTQLDDDTFAITDKYTERTTTYQWTPIEQAKSHLEVIDRCEAGHSGLVNDDVSSKSVRRLLKNHDISLDLFGKEKAKPLDEFVGEVQHGKARLLIDATKPKCLVRVVDVVLLRIFVKTSVGRRYLVETKEQYPDGRVRDSCRLPGHVKAPHENMMQAAERILKDILDMQDCRIIFELNHIDHQETSEDSPSYPGIQTVYSNETLTGVMTVSDSTTLKRVSIVDKTRKDGMGKFEVKDPEQYVRGYQWMSEAECISKGIELRPRNVDNDISSLVYPPIGLNEDALFDYLMNNNVDVSRWGEGTFRSVSEFSEELVKGESTLFRQENGRIVRLVDIVVLKLVKENSVLREVEEMVGERTMALDRLPAMKRRTDEHPFSAARRLLTRYLHFEDNEVNLDPDDVRVLEEEQESTSYPGLLSVYRKRFITAKVNPAAPGAQGVRSHSTRNSRARR